MSLRLRDGPRSNPNNNNNNNPKNQTRSTADDDNTLFTLSGEGVDNNNTSNDQLLDSVLQANRDAKQQSPTNATTTRNAKVKVPFPQKEEVVLDDLLFSNDADERSESESTALSSFVPIVNSSQIRATAPRVASTKQQHEFLTTKTTTNANNNELLPTTRNLLGQPNDDTRIIMNDDVTLGTIDDNLPFDFLVYSEDNHNHNNNNNPTTHNRQSSHHRHHNATTTTSQHHHTTNLHKVGHRQRRGSTTSHKRQYASSNQSVISALGEGSFGHVENTPSGILESLGLGNAANGSGMPVHVEEHPHHSDAKSASSKSIKTKNLGGGGGGSHHVISSHHRTTKQRMKKSNASMYGSSGNTMATGFGHHHHHHHHHASKPTRSSLFKLNARAFLTMTTMVVFIFTFVQYTSILQKEATLLKQRRGGSGPGGFVRRRGHTYNYQQQQQQQQNDGDGHDFEEGVDRPMNSAAAAALMKQMHTQGDATPTDIQLLQTKDKIPSLQNGILAGGGGDGSMIVHGDEIIDEQEDQNNHAQAVPPLEEGPGDPLVVVPSKDVTIPEQEVEENTKSVSVAIQQGFAGVYTLDKNHKDIPFLWFIPRSGTTIAKKIISQCLDLTVASEVGATLKSKDAEKLEIEEAASHNYVNVDPTTVEGIERAKKLNLASSGFANLVVSPRIQEASTIFTAKYHGRAFTMIRHPIERAVSMFYYLQKNKVAAVSKMTIEEYAKSKYVENNWMVRMLSGTMEGPVDDSDLAVAKEVLRTKMLIGLLEQKELSMARFDYYFGWTYSANPVRQNTCKKRILMGDYRTNESAKHKVKEGSQAWNLIAWQNKYDMKLYKYAKSLFLQQATELFSEMPDN